MTYNENFRVKILAILHLMRIKYEYNLQRRHDGREERTNIFPEIFVDPVMRIKPTATWEKRKASSGKHRVREKLRLYIIG